MNPIRQFLSASLIALVFLAILVGGIASSFEESGLFESAIAQNLDTPAPSGPVFTAPVEMNTEPASEATVGIATMTEPAIVSSCPIPPGWVILLVSPGDTVESIAEEYEISPQLIKRENCLVIDDLIPGSKLFVPLLPDTPTPTWTATPTPAETVCGHPNGWVLYTVKQNDTLYSLSLAFYVSVGQLKLANCMTSNLIRVGQRIYVPNISTRTPDPTSPPHPSQTSTPPPATLTPPPVSPSATWTSTPILPTVTGTATPTQTTATPTITVTPTTLPTNTPTLQIITPSPTLPPSETPTFLPTHTPTP
ncbi:MAG TPA: LysM peptidoglycan-binding domain-containing protein [Anaerolineales bacterium]|nr:LysM peptidoglycan-binding domain-containing protein [Anaerolineales bacterium]